MLRRRIITSAAVGLLLALAVGVVGQSYTAGLPDEYTAQSVVIFGSRPTENGSIASSDSVQAAAAGYVAYLSAPSTLREVAEGIGEESADLKEGLAVTQLPATGTIRIDYATTDPDRAARGANALASALARRTVSDPVVYGQVLARAAVPLQPSGPPRTVLLAATILVALLVGAGAATATWALMGLIARRRVGTSGNASPSVPRGTPNTEAPAEDAVRARLAAAMTPSATTAVSAADDATDSSGSNAVAPHVDPAPQPVAGTEAGAAAEAPRAAAEEVGDDATPAVSSGSDEAQDADTDAQQGEVAAEEGGAPEGPGATEHVVDAQAPNAAEDGAGDTRAAETPGATAAPGSDARPKPGPNGRRGPRGRNTARSRKAR